MGSSQFFSGVHLAQSFFFCVVFCRSLFVLSEVCVAQSLFFCVVSCRSMFVLSEVCLAQSLFFCVVFCKSLFVILQFVLLSILWFTASDYSIVYPLIYSFWLLHCLSFDLQLLITPLSILWFTASDYSFGFFNLPFKSLLEVICEITTWNMKHFYLWLLSFVPHITLPWHMVSHLCLLLLVFYHQ